MLLGKYLDFGWGDLRLQVILAAGTGILLGTASLLFSPIIVAGLLMVVLFIYAIIKRPEIGLIGILVATSSIVFEDQLPLISLGGISLHVPDFLLSGLLALIVVRAIVEPEFKIIHTPLDLPMLFFYGAMLLSTLAAFSQSSLDLVLARRALRVVSYYLTFFVATNLVRERRQLLFLMNSIFLLATIVAGVMIAQFSLGQSVAILPGRVEDLATVGVVYEGITRIIPPGLSLVLLALISVFCIIVMEKMMAQSLLMFFQVGILGIAVIFTFLRSYWAVLVVIFFLMVVILKGNERKKHFIWIISALIIAAVGLTLVMMANDTRIVKLIGASANRLVTIFSSGTFQGHDSSLNYRLIENQYAIPQIISHPLIGMGLGAKYRPLDPRLDFGTDIQRSYIHNGFLLILLQTGLFGFLAFLWLSSKFLLRGFTSWRKIDDNRLRGVFLGFTLTYLAVLLATVVNSTFAQWYWTPVIGLMMGVNEVILIRHKVS